MTTSIVKALAGEVILVRLLASGKRPPTPAKLRDDLGRYFAKLLEGEQWQAQLNDLVEAGLLTLGPYRLTEAGRAQALQFLGLEALPPRATWNTIRNRYLVPKALGVPASSETARKVSTADGLGAYLLRTHYQLPTGAGASLARAINALVFKELGFPTETTFAGLKAAILSRLLSANGKLKRKEIEQQLPRQLVRARRAGADGLRDAILTRWLDDGGEVASAAAEADGRSPDAHIFDLAAFAATVMAAARHCPTGRFGENKVFISHVWRYLGHEPGVPQLDLADFKARLAHANHAGLLQLSRADLVQVMDPADVRDSETQYLDAVFHLVLI